MGNLAETKSYETKRQHLITLPRKVFAVRSQKGRQDQDFLPNHSSRKSNHKFVIIHVL